MASLHAAPLEQQEHEIAEGEHEDYRTEKTQHPSRWRE
eukprot:CAMPEP_0117472468 /NCGR_PEP_ID=MMETSP0784-20121206/8262_1 /TAXON_ID=39447 /ORGANISM="" /LENGTH=37 /DNA_ID= /DNA_START= /DNA_END= /DNA_ORIENTATION=